MMLSRKSSINGITLTEAARGTLVSTLSCLSTNPTRTRRLPWARRGSRGEQERGDRSQTEFRGLIIKVELKRPETHGLCSHDVFVALQWVKISLTSLGDGAVRVTFYGDFKSIQRLRSWVEFNFVARGVQG
ncbi:hypothetical protein GGQ85_001008 [Nitrobacter vulgaris]|nr:hypothetical protein [Nitrobacter vulgaris]